jgi:hypothetical protein
MFAKQIELYFEIKQTEYCIKFFENRLANLRDKDYILFPRTIENICKKLNHLYSEYDYLKQQQNLYW